MLAHEGDQAAHFLRQFVSLHQAVIRRREAVRALSWAVAAGASLLTVVLLVDAAFGLPAPARPAAHLAAAATALAMVSGTWVWARRRRPSAFYVARLIEMRRPELKNALVTFVEMTLDPSADPSMVRAVARRAATVLAHDEPALIVQPASVRRPAAAALASTVALATTLWLCQGVVLRPWVATALGRTPVPSLAGDGQGPASSWADSLVDDFSESPLEGASRAGGPSVDNAGLAAREAGRPDAGRTHHADTAEAPLEDLAATIRAFQADAEKFERLAAALGTDGLKSPGGRTVGAPGGSAEEAETGPRLAPGGREDAIILDADTLGRDAATGRAEPGSGAGTVGPGRRSKDTASAAAEGGAATGGRTLLPDSQSGGDGGTPRGTGGRASGGARPDVSGGRPAFGRDLPLPQHEPVRGFPPEVLDSLRRVRQIIDKAEERLSDADAGRDFMGRMGQTPAQMRAFLTAWRQRLESLPQAPERSGQADAAAGGSIVQQEKGEWLRATGASATRPIVAVRDGPTDRKAGLVEAGREVVSARLQPAVDAYFEAVGRMAAQGQKDRPK